MLKPQKKEKLIKEYKIHETDTGSTEVQIALLTERIAELVSHLKKNPKDFGSKRGLLTIVAQRKKLLEYLKSESDKRYKELAKKLGIKK